MVAFKQYIEIHMTTSGTSNVEV